MAHGDAFETVYRHSPFWHALSSTVIFVTPEDNRLNIPGTLEVSVGKRGHDGPASNARVRKCFEIGASWPGKLVSLQEYDTICTRLTAAMLPPKGGVTAHHRKNNKPEKYTSPRYLWFPELWDPAGMLLMQHAMGELPEDAEYGVSDRYIGLAAHLAGIPVKNAHKHGWSYSQNTIKPEHHRDLQHAVAGGACWFHGIKDEATLRLAAVR